MCVIAVSPIGVKQPAFEQLKAMFEHNPHGAGYMYARNGKVYIHKGFMDFAEYYREIRNQHFTKADPVVYHCRISTQAGVNPYMTHPFPLTERKEDCELLDFPCDIGIAHNGIIRLTSDPKEKRYSDTVTFIAEYMTKLIRTRADITNPAVITMIDKLTNSKWAIMDGITGQIVTIGNFIDEGGLLFSNAGYKPYTYKSHPKTTIISPVNFSLDDYYEGAYGIDYERTGMV